MKLHPNMAARGFAVICVTVALGVGPDQAVRGAQHEPTASAELLEHGGDAGPGVVVPHWLVEIIGRLAALGLLTTAILGLLFRRARWKVLKFHRACAIAAIGMGLCHGVLALVARMGGG